MNYRLKLRLLELLPASLRTRLLERRHRSEVEFSGEAELAHLGELVRDGDVAIDVGCNLGAYARELSRLASRVIAFEPNPHLARFVRSLDLPGVEVREIALGNRQGRGQLAVPQVEGGGHGCASLRESMASEPLDETLAVDIATLDSEAPAKVDFVKIDVEGFEESVLAGAMNLLENAQPILLVEIEERHNSGGLERICDRLAGLGYRTYFLRLGKWQPIAQFEAKRDQDTAMLARNMRDGTPRRLIDYINNFLFVPAGRTIAGIA